MADGGSDESAGDDFARNLNVEANSYCFGPPKKEPESEFAAMDCDGDASDECAHVGIDDYYCDYPPKEVEPEFVDVSGHPIKQEPNSELDSGDGGASDDYAPNFSVGTGNYDPLKKEPKQELGTADGSDDCYHGGDPPNETPEPNLPTTSDGDRARVGTDDYYCDYLLPKEEPKSECIDVCYDPVKEEPKSELGDVDTDAIDANCSDDWYQGCDPPEDEPEFVTIGDNASAEDGQDVGYDCSHCGTSLSTRKLKVEHELRCKVRMEQKGLESQVTEVYHCSYCSYPFVKEEYKEQHQQKWCPKMPVVEKKRSNDTNFKCDKCKYVTKWKHHLKKHVLKHDKNNAEWFACTQCSYKTVHKYDMARHTKTHGNAFTCCCPICRQSFRTKQCLEEHLLKKHFDESDDVPKLITSQIYTCHICNQYRTIRKADFDDHITTTYVKGAGCRKYQCPHCPYFTFREKDLKVHSEVHAEHKNCQCTVCNKQFAQKRYLDSHILYIHSDNVDLVKTITSKIHCCESCSYKTVINTNLKRHVQSKHS